MMNLVNNMRNLVLTLSLLLGTSLAFGASDTADEKIQEEMNKFADESAKLREDHIQQMRELHLKHVNELYDRKLAQSKEMAALWKQLKPGDKAANKALRSQIKKKQDVYKDDEEKRRKDFKENVLGTKNKEFQEFMKARNKEMKGKFKD